MLGWPFLEHNWQSYLNGAFDLGRVFTFTWTVGTSSFVHDGAFTHADVPPSQVNWKFLPEEIFVSKELALVLLHCNSLASALFM